MPLTRCHLLTKSFTCLLLLATCCKILAQQPIEKLPATPKSIAVDSKDNVILHASGRIIKISPEGGMSYITEDIRKGVPRNPLPTCVAMAIDPTDQIYIADQDMIWKLGNDGKATIFAGAPYIYKVKDGPLQAARFREIEMMEFDHAGNIFIAERDNTNKDNLGDFYLVRKISTNGMVTTVLNTRENPEFKSKWINGMGVDNEGNVYLSDGSGRCIKKLDINGRITTVAGLCGKREFHPIYVQGDISKAELMSPADILINKKGEVVFTDSRLHRIIKISNNQVNTVAGNSMIQPNSVNMGGRAKEGYQDGKALTALFNFPLGCNIALDGKQNIYVIDGGNDCVRKLTPDGTVTTLAKR